MKIRKDQTSFGMEFVVVQGPKHFKRKVSAVKPAIHQIGGAYLCVVTNNGWFKKTDVAIWTMSREGNFISKVIHNRVFRLKSLLKMIREGSYCMDRAVNGAARNLFLVS